MDHSIHGHSKKDLHILVLGRTGSGKSTLINAMLGDHQAQQSYSALPTQHDTVEIHTCTIGQDLRVYIYDTPGFFDCRISTGELLSRLQSSFPEGFDLVILCYRIIDKFDEMTITWLETFCKHYYHYNYPYHQQDRLITPPNIVVALTFTNFFLDFPEVSDLKYNDAKIEVLKRKTTDFKTLFNKTSAKTLNGVQFFQNVPFVMTGLSRQRRLPTTTDWLSDFWLACSQQCVNDAKTLVNILRFRLYFDANGVNATTSVTNLSGIVSLMVAAIPVLPTLGISIEKTMETSANFREVRRIKTPFECPLSRERNDEIDCPEIVISAAPKIVEQKKESGVKTSTTRLPSVKPEEFSSDIFEALGLK